MKDFHDSETGEILTERQLASFADQMMFQASFLECQKAMPLTIKRDADGGRGKYVPLSKIIETVRPKLNEHGFSLRQGICFSAFAETSSKCAFVEVYTDIWHAPTCLYQRTKIPIPMPKLDPQAAGSAMTYGKRYTLLAALGISDGDHDDDGAAAMPRKITEDVQDSPELAKLKVEMCKIKEPTELVAWAGEQKNKSRINDLSEAETEKLRTFFKERQAALLKDSQGD